MKSVVAFTILAAGVSLGSGCSSPEGRDASSAFADHGPTVLYARSEPGLIELNRESQPLQPAEVYADVKDFNSRISEVRLRFANVPIDVPMENVGGTTWRATLTPRQLAQLAEAGKTKTYDARVFARNADGDVAMSRRPVELAIRAPESPTQMAGTANRR